MSESIRMVHFADLHVGMQNYGRLDPATGMSTRVQDFLDRLDEVIDYALAQDVDLVVFAGDAFKNRDPNPTQLREFSQRIRRLAEKIPTLLLAGNHDMPSLAVKATSLDVFAALDVPGVIVGNTPDGRVVETRRGPVYLAWMPYPMRNRLLRKEQHQHKHIDELEAAMQESVAKILRKLADDAGKHAMPRVLCGHFSVTDAKYGSERTVLIGRDVAVQKSELADPVWDYVALGHIHRHQVVNPDDYPALVYSGSLERIDFGEENEEKGFCRVDLLRSATSWNFIPVAARRFKTLEVDARGEVDPTDIILRRIEQEELDEVVVRIRVDLDASQEAALREKDIRSALDTAADVTLSRQISEEDRSRLRDIAPETLHPRELLQLYFQAVKEPDERIQVLLDHAEELLRDSN